MFSLRAPVAIGAGKETWLGSDRDYTYDEVSLLTFLAVAVY